MNNVSQSDSPPGEMFLCDLPPTFPPSLNIPPAVNYIQATIALVLGATGFLLNLFILFVILSYKSLRRQRQMFLALHIVVVDLVYTLTVPLVIFVSGVSGVWFLGGAMCNILGIIHDVFAMFRFMSTLVLTLDRFISVFWPFFESLRLIVGALVAMYVVSTLRGLLPISGILGCYTYIPTLKTCSAYSACSAGCFWFVVGSTAIIVVFGVAIPLVLYVVLFCKIRGIKKRSHPSLGKFTEDPTTSNANELRINLEISIDTEKSSLANSVECAANLQAYAALKSNNNSTTAANILEPRNNDSSSIHFDNTEIKRSSVSIETDAWIEDDTPNSFNNGILCVMVLTSKCENNAESQVSGESLAQFEEPEFVGSDKRDSMSRTTVATPPFKDGPPKSRTDKRNSRTNVTMFILLMSVIGCTTPAFLLYGVQFISLTRKPALFIINMMVGRTFFNLLPVVDGIAIMRHKEFRGASNKLIRSIRQKLSCETCSS